MDAYKTENLSTDFESAFDLNSSGDQELESASVSDMLVDLEESQHFQDLDAEFADFTQSDLTLEVNPVDEFDLDGDLNRETDPALDLDLMDDGSDQFFDPSSLDDSQSAFELDKTDPESDEPHSAIASPIEMPSAMEEWLSADSSQPAIESEFAQALELAVETEFAQDTKPEAETELTAASEFAVESEFFVETEPEAETELAVEMEFAAETELAEDSELTAASEFAVESEFFVETEPEAETELAVEMEFAAETELAEDSELTAASEFAVESEFFVETEPEAETESAIEMEFAAESELAEDSELTAASEFTVESEFFVETEPEAEIELAAASEFAAESELAEESELTAASEFAVESEFFVETDLAAEPELDLLWAPEAPSEPEPLSEFEVDGDLESFAEEAVAPAVNPGASEAPELEALETEAEDQGSRVAKLESEISTLRTENEQYRLAAEAQIQPEDYQALQAQVQQLIEQVRGWEQRYEDLSQRLEEQTQLATNRIDAEETLKQQLKAYSEQVETLQSEKAILEQAVQDWQRQAESKIDPIDYQAALEQLERLKEKHSRSLWTRILDWFKG